MRRVERLLSPIRKQATIAEGSGIRELASLHRNFGDGYWRKLKGQARIEDEYGDIYWAEIHWYEAHGIGQRLMKVKYRLE